MRLCLCFAQPAPDSWQNDTTAHVAEVNILISLVYPWGCKALYHPPGLSTCFINWVTEDGWLHPSSFPCCYVSILSRPTVLGVFTLQLTPQRSKKANCNKGLDGLVLLPSCTQLPTKTYSLTCKIPNPQRQELCP